ncbi:MAG: molybdopterin molybdotransferase MoeA [Chloroflexi bacterium]|jgi:molybdopterin molybdotransferase|nr:molybdopterin molybdotransferase MoeA [Anaerolineaceae bacterium]NLI44471.1 molybdopterin molybdotransferase MoeA [Chloroflexota bacterium]HOE35544.1 molybdopterin molybdotransferase MoeA [Anaerolineaceae bacterium]HOT26430.1 molybdopterin molybdotransferase MoeA [Anaerolineaceae bacterium]HQK04283.1 molybdopterin molybdotransferase MoeA [Anaerolineaceae bacterium]
MLNVITIAEAQALIAHTFGRLRMPAESVLLAEAGGRALAEDVLAREFVPDFDRSTVDGYALRSQDVFGCSESIPALLTLIGSARMGEHTAFSLSAGQCVYVPTGAEIPAGADTVVMLEDAEVLDDGLIAVYKAAPPGANLIFRGDDVRPGDVLLTAGTRLTTAHIGSLAAMGYTAVSVRRQPRAAVISTGDELVPAGEDLPLGKIRDVNAPMLAQAVLEAGGRADFLGIIPDRIEEVRAALKSALADHDLVLLSGGTSVGEKDAVPQVLSEQGELLAHGLAVKPGKPTLFGSAQGKPVFGLPGNPVAAYFIFHLLVRPLLASMLGTDLEDRRVRVPVARAVPSNHGREEYVPVALRDGEAQPIPSKSGLITTLARADGYIAIPRDKEGLRQGELVEVTLLKR